MSTWPLSKQPFRAVTGATCGSVFSFSTSFVAFMIANAWARRIYEPWVSDAGQHAYEETANLIVVLLVAPVAAVSAAIVYGLILAAMLSRMPFLLAMLSLSLSLIAGTLFGWFVVFTTHPAWPLYIALLTSAGPFFALIYALAATYVAGERANEPN